MSFWPYWGSQSMLVLPERTKSNPWLTGYHMVGVRIYVCPGLFSGRVRDGDRFSTWFWPAARQQWVGKTYLCFSLPLGRGRARLSRKAVYRYPQFYYWWWPEMGGHPWNCCHCGWIRSTATFAECGVKCVISSTTTGSLLNVGNGQKKQSFQLGFC